MASHNGELETLLRALGVPVCYMYYNGTAVSYVTYMETDKASPLGAEDEVIGYVSYYDFDIYSKSNYFAVKDHLHMILTSAGWTYQPSRESPDMYDPDTGYYHKTVCYCKETMI